MTTAQDLVDEVKRHLLGGTAENLNRLNGSITSGATTLIYEFATFGGLTAGATIEIDLELMYVWSVNTSTLTVTVQRGFAGTTAASHSSGAVITVNPKFPQFSILTALNQEITDLSSPTNGLYRVVNTDLTSVSGVTGYDFSVSNYIDIHEIHYEADSAMLAWRRIDDYRLVQLADSTDFPSGRALMINEWVGESGGIVHVSYKAGFTTLAALSTDVATTGLATSMYDIPPLGAMVRLTATRGVKRAFDESQGEPRRAGEVNEQAMIQNSSAILSLRRQRINAEAARLKQQYPYRLRAVNP